MAMTMAMPTILSSQHSHSHLLGVQYSRRPPPLPMVSSSTMRVKKMDQLPPTLLHRSTQQYMPSTAAAAAAVRSRPLHALSPAHQPSLMNAEAWMPEEEEAGKMEELVFAIKRDLAFLEEELVGDKSSSPALEALKMVDLIERLGIQRFFQDHIQRILRLTYIQWHEKFGLKDSVDATVLAFRLLRLHGYLVSTGTFETWKDKNGSFSKLFAIDTPANVSSMINLFKCYQVSFPSESKIMAEAKEFATSQLRRALLERDESLIVTNNLEMEINFTLEYPRKYLLPRLESKNIIKQLSPSSGCIQRCLELAKIDLEMLRKLHREEIDSLEQWWKHQECYKVINFRGGIVKCHFFVAGVIFEPQFSAYRMAFTKAAYFATILDDLMDSPNYADAYQLHNFNEAVQKWDPSPLGDVPKLQAIFGSLTATMEELAAQASGVQGRDVLPYYKSVWQELVGAYEKTAQWRCARHVPTMEEYMKSAIPGVAGTAVTWSSLFLMNETISDETLQIIGKDSRFMHLVNYVCRLSNDIVSFEREADNGEVASAISCYMKENPGCTQQEAVAALEGMIESGCRELEWELLRSTGLVADGCLRAFLSFARAICFVCKGRDSFTLAHGIHYAKLFEEYLYQPLLL